jgi:methylenetetrahydrofolate dehydrogenase (NADP+)/methenyltetrahydrofolate cyclohydrolase
MPAQLIDGKALADSLRAEIRTRAERFAKEHGRPPGLEVVLVGDDPASQVYVRNKDKAAAEAAFRGVVHRMPASSTEEEVIAKVRALNADAAVDGILVQLPLPEHIEAQRVVDAISPAKDVDGLHPVNAGLLASGRPGLRPCTPSGVMRMLASIGAKLGGKRAVVVGRSNLVGKPLALMLLEKNATVTIAHSKTADLKEVCREADILVAAVGVAHLIRGDFVKPGAIVIDVGMNRGEDKKLTGDVDFAAAREHASFITPVPGGVGPMTIAVLLANTLEAAERSRS